MDLAIRWMLLAAGGMLFLPFPAGATNPYDEQEAEREPVAREPVRRLRPFVPLEPVAVAGEPIAVSRTPAWLAVATVRGEAAAVARTLPSPQGLDRIPQAAAATYLPPFYYPDPSVTDPPLPEMVPGPPIPYDSEPIGTWMGVPVPLEDEGPVAVPALDETAPESGSPPIPGPEALLEKGQSRTAKAESAPVTPSPPSTASPEKKSLPTSRSSGFRWRSSAADCSSGR